MMSCSSSVLDGESLRRLSLASTDDSSREEHIFQCLQEEARNVCESELIGQPIREVVLGSSDLAEIIAEVISRRLAMNLLPRAELKKTCVQSLRHDARPGLDLCAILERDPATVSFLQCVMFLKGFQATQAHRVAAKLWRDGSASSKHIAFALQHRTSEAWGVDIHPAATIGHGLLLDHATGIVIGETARVGNDCTILHGVTLGGTGKERGDRHPKIQDRVSIGAGATILGNIDVCHDATVGAMAVVTKRVPPGMTVVGLNRILDPLQRKDAVSKRKETWWAETDSDSYDYFSVSVPMSTTAPPRVATMPEFPRPHRSDEDPDDDRSPMW